jgi:crossover junction endodeoxyribonuclease RusA
MLSVELPFPPADLFPNRKNGRHWSSTSEIKSNASMCAYTLTYQAVSRYKGEWYPLTGDIPMTLTFIAPDKRHRDLDNMLAACKAYLDGVATALTVNDKQFGPILLKRGEARKGGAVLVEIGA